MAGSSRRRAIKKALERAERLLAAGDAAKAAPLVEDALRQDPESAQAHHLAARIVAGGGNLAAALAHAKRACDLAPDDAGYLTTIAQLLQATGRDAEAAGALHAALRQDPNSAKAAARLGFLLRRMGDLGGALGAFGRAVTLDRSGVNAYLGWVDLLGRATTPAYDAALAEDLLAALEGPLSAPEELAPAIARQLRQKYDFAAATPVLDASDPLLAAYLERCLNVDPVIETALATERARLIGVDAEAWPAPEAAMARLIALQGFVNEYVMFESDAERAALAALGDGLETTLAAGEVPAPRRLLTYAMYRPLSSLAGAERLAELDWPGRAGDLADVVRLTLADALTERRLRDTIPALSEIADATSRKVRDQYEEHPYPRWTAPTPQAAQHPAALLSAMFRHFEPPKFLDERLSVLIAGCGTGRHTVAVAQAFPKARITAIDLSRASLGFGLRMLTELGIAKGRGGGIRLLQADILDAARLEGPFDMVQSVGVLHHMAEPIAGWRVLASLLRPGGVMKIGLYAERGRRGVLKCRDIIAAEGIGSTDADMRAFRHRLLAAPPGGDFDKVMQRADFYSLSMCRDLLFHIQEVCYTPARIKSELAELGLEFVGFEEVEALGLAAQYRERFPSNPALDDLDNWEALEAVLDDPPEGYVFWCRKPGP
jgi:SAM-dependent methyltransferase/Flp pilus assembly protein TadD